MATKTLNTRVCLKRDTYGNWELVKDSFVPLSGEACVVVVLAASGAVAQEPAVLIKIGDGTTALSGLPYVSAIAADVYDWAKTSTKPTYSASEIDGLADYISGEVNDTNTQYNLETDATDDHKLIFSKKDIGDTDYTTVATITIPDDSYDDTALSDSLDALKTLVGTIPSTSTAATVIGYIDEQIAAADHLKRKIVTSTDDIDLTAADASQYIYMVPNADAESGNLYDEYMVLDGKLERVGDWAVDLSDYAKTADLGALATKDTVAKTDLDTDLAAELDGKADTADLAAIATSGDANDLVQADGDYLILSCGTASTVV